MVWRIGAGSPAPLAPDAADEHEEQPENEGSGEGEAPENFGRYGGQEWRDEHAGSRQGEHGGEGCRAYLEGSPWPDAAGHPPPGEGVEPGDAGRCTGIFREMEDAPGEERNSKGGEERKRPSNPGEDERQVDGEDNGCQPDARERVEQTAVPVPVTLSEDEREDKGERVVDEVPDGVAKDREHYGNTV